jgi:hypothetical protein
MSTPPKSEVRWLDFSGAPPMLIPQILAEHWRGTTDPATGKYRELDQDNPVTDYDRACATARPDSIILEFRGAPILVFYTEHDRHAWDVGRQILACGGWLPSEDEVRRATWTDPIRWRAEHTDYLLMNSAADGSADLLDDDFMSLRLPSGLYTIERADISSIYLGVFHRFVRDDHAK